MSKFLNDRSECFGIALFTLSNFRFPAFVHKHSVCKHIYLHFRMMVANYRFTFIFSCSLNGHNNANWNQCVIGNQDKFKNCQAKNCESKSHEIEKQDRKNPNKPFTLMTPRIHEDSDVNVNSGALFNRCHYNGHVIGIEANSTCATAFIRSNYLFVTKTTGKSRIKTLMLPISLASLK